MKDQRDGVPIDLLLRDHCMSCSIVTALNIIILVSTLQLMRLYPMRYQIAFRQYNPNKPHRYGLLVKSLSDAELPFTYKTVPNAGKPEAEDCPYYIDSFENYVKYLVNETEKDISLKGRNISTDPLYTSIPLANWLLERDITTLGTLNMVRHGIPDELEKPNGTEEFSTTCHFEAENGDLCLMNYTVKSKSKGKNNILMLTTLRPLNGKTKDDKKQKPAFQKLYDFTKGDTDIVDQLIDYYTTRAAS